MDGTHRDPLVNVHRSPNDSVLKTTPETICEYLSFVIVSKAMSTLYWIGFTGATTGGYLLWCQQERSWDPFLESPGNFSGSKSYIQIEM